jgi:DNA mismatch endonuclease (patch repair protein)
MPKSRTEFWTAKFKGTVERDRTAENALRDLGWHVTVIWECELEDESKLASKLGEAIQREA